MLALDANEVPRYYRIRVFVHGDLVANTVRVLESDSAQVITRAFMDAYETEDVRVEVFPA